jgi:hypothetical protein
MLLNTLVAGGVFAAYLTVLFLQLNPAVPIHAAGLSRLAASLLVWYGAWFALTFFMVLLVRQALAETVFSPGWLSFQLLVWLCLVASATAATLMWLNLSRLRVTLDDVAARQMAMGAVALTFCIALLLVLGMFRFSFGRGGRTGPVAFGLVLAASVAVPLWLRGPAHAGEVSGGSPVESAPAFAASPGARVTIIVVDGASLDFIAPAVADGRLPNFGRIFDAGAVMHLATLRPTQPGPVLTAIATGKLPMRTGVRSAALYGVRRGRPALEVLPDFCFAHALVSAGLLDESPHTSASLRARPLWAILSASGMTAAVVRWPLTYPPQPLRGDLVTDHLHLVRPAARATYPPDLAARLRTVPESPGAASAAAALEPAGAPPYAGGAALALDRLYARAFDAVREDTDAQLLAVRYVGVDSIGHAYLRQAMPRAFGDVPEEERRRFGSVLEQYYRYLDGEIGRAIQRLGRDDLLLVVSPFGMQPLSLPKRLLERALGNPESGTHERAPDGFLMAVGSNVRPGRLRRASVLDVTPTVLYYFGLPIGRDMDGYARTDVFTRAFTAARPLAFIPTYEQ